MKKENNQRQVKLRMEYLPTKDRNFRLSKETVVDAPQFTECTYDVGFQVLKELGTSCYSVYMALLSYRNTLRNDCHPSVKRIHEDFNISESTINRCINKLYKEGYIDINSGYKGVASNYYFPKEYWYESWNQDFYQSRAQRNKGKSSAIKEERPTMEQKIIRQLQEENARLRASLNNSYKNA